MREGRREAKGEGGEDKGKKRGVVEWEKEKERRARERERRKRGREERKKGNGE